MLESRAPLGPPRWSPNAPAARLAHETCPGGSGYCRIVCGRGMHGGERTRVAGNHRLDQIERFAAADFADHDPIGSHSQRVNKQVPNRYTARPIGLGWLSFEVNRMRLI